jgi:hypothetical protein
LGFLVIGHTQRNIEIFFGYFSKKIKERKSLCVGKLYERFYGVPKIAVQPPTNFLNS